MATDGVKIIDGDTAHDIYWGILDFYDEGAALDEIRARFPFPCPDQYDDFEYEMYSTGYTLAMWEIGELTNEEKEETKKIIDKGAGVKTWTEETNEKTGKQRQKELDKFWVKINTSNPKIRKRKKYKTIRDFLFEINDVLAFQLPDQNYCVTILLTIKKYRGYCTYGFGKLLYSSTVLPTIDYILNGQIIGRKIPSGVHFDVSMIQAMGYDEIVKQGGIQSILEKEAERTGHYIIGLSKIGIDHSHLIPMKDKFTKIGTIDLGPVSQNSGSYCILGTFENLTLNFSEIETSMIAFKETTFKIKDLIEIKTKHDI